MSKLITMQEWQDQHPGNKPADEKLFLTEAEVRSFPDFKEASPEEIENIIGTLHDLALVCYERFCRETAEDKRLSEAA